MNVTIIYGTIIESSTYNCVQLLLDNLKINSNINVTEVFLQDKSLYFSQKYFSATGDCDNFSIVYNVAKSLYKADLIILASSVFACDISAEMKSFLNNLSICYKSNKSNLSTNNTLGLVMSTSSGAGLFYATKILKRNLNFLGIKKILGFSKTLYETDWEYMNEKTKKHISKKIYKLSNKILSLYNDLPNNVSPIYAYNEISSKTTLKFKNNSDTIINFADFKKTIPSSNTNIQ